MQFLSGGNIHIDNLEKLAVALECELVISRNKGASLLGSRLSIDKKKLERFCKKNGVSSVALFGSVLREDFKKGSDIDVMIKMKRPVNFFELADVEAGLKDIFNTKHKLDIVTEEGLSHLIRPDVERSKEVIYEEAA